MKLNNKMTTLAATGLLVAALSLSAGAAYLNSTECPAGGTGVCTASTQNCGFQSRGMRGNGIGRLHERPVEVFANITEQDVADVLTEMQDGKTLGELAESAGVMDELKQTLLDDAKESLEAAVTDGRLTQEDADTRYSDMETRITDTDFDGMNRPDFAGQGMGRGQGKGRGCNLRNATSAE